MIHRVYLAGPMRKIEAFNFPAFLAAEAALVQAGYEVFNPAQRDLLHGFDPTGMTGHEDLSALGFSLRDALADDTHWICKFGQAVVALPGAEHSKGSRAEMALAEALGIPVMSLEQALEAASCPTS